MASSLLRSFKLLSVSSDKAAIARSSARAFSAEAKPSLQAKFDHVMNRPKKMKIPTKRCGHLLEQLNQDMVAKSGKTPPNFRPGDAIEVKFYLSKSSQRLQSVRGIVIARRNRGINSSFTIRNHASGDAFEVTHPLYNPLIEEISVIRERAIHGGKKRVRRAKLFYLRDKAPRFSTVQ